MALDSLLVFVCNAPYMLLCFIVFYKYVGFETNIGDNFGTSSARPSYYHLITMGRLIAIANAGGVVESERDFLGLLPRISRQIHQHSGHNIRHIRSLLQFLPFLLLLRLFRRRLRILLDFQPKR